MSEHSGSGWMVSSERIVGNRVGGVPGGLVEVRGSGAGGAWFKLRLRVLKLSGAKVASLSDGVRECDLFLVGESFDAYFDGKKGVYLWVDNFEKGSWSGSLGAMGVVRGLWSRVVAEVGRWESGVSGSTELVMFPYPSGLCEDYDLGQFRLRSAYERAWGMRDVDGYLMAGEMQR